MAGLAQRLQINAAAPTGAVKQTIGTRQALGNITNGSDKLAKAGGKPASFIKQAEQKPWAFAAPTNKSSEEKVSVFTDDDEQIQAQQPQQQELPPIEGFDFAQSGTDDVLDVMGADLVDAQLDAVNDLDNLLAADNDMSAEGDFAAQATAELSSVNLWRATHLPCSAQLAAEMRSVDAKEASDAVVFGETVLDEAMTDKQLGRVLQSALGAAI